MDLGYRGRRVVVIGGSYGIGHAAALQMCREGAEVMLVSRDAARLDEAADAIAAATGTRPSTLAVDMTTEGAGERVAAAVAARWSALDALVTAVGGSIRSAFPDLTDDDWMGNYAFNILSTVRAIRALTPLLREGNGPAIVTLGAAASKMPYPHQIVSNVHKAGILGLTKTLAGEYAADGIRVNCVAPGRTLTPLWTNRADAMAAERGTDRESVLEEFSKEIPLARFGEPAEVAVMVTWLCSPLASYVTGQAINVDGGIAKGLL